MTNSGPGRARRARAQRQLALDEHVRRIVEQAPPLTQEQRDRLAALLAPARAAVPALRPPSEDQ